MTYVAKVIAPVIGVIMCSLGCSRLPQVLIRPISLAELASIPNVAAAYHERIETLGPRAGPIYMVTIEGDAGHRLVVYGFKEMDSGIDRPDLLVLRYPIVQDRTGTILRYQLPDHQKPGVDWLLLEESPEVLVDVRPGRANILWCEGVAPDVGLSPCVKALGGSVRTVLCLSSPEGEGVLWLHWILHADTNKLPAYHLGVYGSNTGERWPVWFNEHAEVVRIEVPAKIPSPDAERVP